MEVTLGPIPMKDYHVNPSILVNNSQVVLFLLEEGANLHSLLVDGKVIRVRVVSTA